MDPTQKVPAEIAAEPLVRIPGIEIDRVLGRGGMGLVLHGHQTLLRREVAVKVLKPGENVSAEFEDRFRREARILAGVQHPNIVSCYHADTLENGSPYIVMEFVRGPNLREWIGKRGPAHPTLVLEVCRSLALALDHAYRHKIIHRDIKPENVLLEPTDDPTAHFPFEVKLADLGLARYADAEHTLLTAPGAVMGTPATMAPEQYLAPESVDFKADIYGLGCVLFYMLTGRHAFTQPSIAMILDAKKDAPLGPDPSESSIGLPGPVAKLVRRMMARDPDERPASYDDLIATCSELLHTPPALPASPRRRSKRARIAAGVVGGVVLLGASFAIFGREPESVQGAQDEDFVDPGGTTLLPGLSWVDIAGERGDYRFGERVRLEAAFDNPDAARGASFAWKVVKGPKVELGAANGRVLEFTAPQLEREARMLIGLTVTRPGKDDGVCEFALGLHHNRPPKPFVREPAPHLPGDDVTLRGGLDDLDPWDTELRYEWVQTGGRKVMATGENSRELSFKVPNYVPRGENELAFVFRVDDGELEAETSASLQIDPIPLRRGESRALFAEELPASVDWDYRGAHGEWNSFSEREEDEIEGGIRSCGFGEDCSIDYLALPGGQWRLQGSLWLVNEEGEVCDSGALRFDCGDEGVEFGVRRDGDGFVSRLEGVDRDEAGDWHVSAVGEVAGRVDEGGSEHVTFAITWNAPNLEFEWNEGMHRDSVPLERRPEVLTLLSRGRGRVAFDQFVLLGQ